MDTYQAPSNPLANTPKLAQDKQSPRRKHHIAGKYQIAATPATKTRTKNQAEIIKVKALNKNLSCREIAAITKVNPSTVSRTIARYGVDYGLVESYIQSRGDVFAAFQEKILTSCTDEDIKKASFPARILAAMQLYTNERLERGLSTANTSIQIGLSGALQDSIDRLVARTP